MAIAEKSTLFTWNSVQSGGTIEFEERALILTKSSVIAGAEDSTGAPIVKTATIAGTVLKAIEDVTNGGVVLSWENDEAGHTQNTDTGTTSQTFAIDSDTHNVKIKAESATKFGLRNAADDGYVNLQAATIKGQMLSLNPEAGESETYLVSELIPHNSIDEETLTVSNDSQRINVQAKRFLATQETPLDDLELTTKGWVEDQIAASFGANDAMVFKGTVGSGGTHTIAAFNSLATYQAGWTYRVIEAGTVKGKVCEIGDLVIAIVDRAGSGNVDADWTVAQTNVDGAVTADAALTDNQLVLGKGGAKGVDTLGAGTDGYVLKMVSGVPAWAANPNGIPSNGASAQMLQYTSAGAVKWISVSGDMTIADGGAVSIGDNKILTKHISASNVTLAKIENSDAAGLSVIGRSVNSAGVFDEINAANDFTALRRYGNTVGFGRIHTPYLELIGNSEITTPTAYNIGAGTYIGQMTFDGNFIYICITAGASGTARWVRIPAAKVWSAA